MSAISIVAPSRESANLSDFDTRHLIDARFAGGAITVDAEHLDWCGTDVIRVEIPGLVFVLQPHEARDLAQALLALATYVEEEGSAL